MATKSISNPAQLVQSGIQKIQSTLTPVSLPQIMYKGQPVVTTELLAQLYDCEASSIHTNFSRNRARFIEGKHFYSLANGELKAFRDCLTDCKTVVPARARNLTLWLERGAARHAKMLNTDKAWDVFEMLEETFFRATPTTPPSPKSLPASLRLSTTADPERKELTALVNAWVGCAPIHYAGARSIVNAHFGVKSIDELTVTQVKEAIAFVQGKIADVGRSTQPALPDGRVIPARGTGLTLEALRDELDAEQCRVATWAKQFHARLSEQSGPLYKYVMQSMLGPSVKDSGCIGISVDTPIGALHESAYRGCDSIKNGFAELEQAVRLARFFAKALDR